MTFAILAAGEGSRLEKEGIHTPKPLISIHGETLIERLLRIFSAHKADRIVVVINSRMTAVRERLDMLTETYPNLHYVVADTPSSMHSLWEMRDLLRHETFVLTTVDTIFREEDFGQYLTTGGFAVTPFVDDEKPLWVETDEAGRITAFRDEGICRYVSAGIYCITPRMMQVLEECIERGESRMRNFQRAILNAGIEVKAYPIDRVYDIDHRDDIDKAERFLCRDILFVRRHKTFCKGRNDDDVMADAMGKELEERGYTVTYTEEVGLSPALLNRTWHVILSMARCRETLALLKTAYCPVINMPEGVERASQRRDDGEVTPPCWVKRNGHTQHPGDVVYARTETERTQAMEEMHSRGVYDIVCQRHYMGHEVKFYGVANDFFYPSDIPILKTVAERMAHDTGTEVYGGDAILLRDEAKTEADLVVIDFNDWPSFSPCRNEAVKAIAGYVIHKK